MTKKFADDKKMTKKEKDERFVIVFAEDEILLHYLPLFLCLF